MSEQIQKDDYSDVIEMVRKANTNNQQCGILLDMEDAKRFAKYEAKRHSKNYHLKHEILHIAQISACVVGMGFNLIHPVVAILFCIPCFIQLRGDFE